MISIEESFCFRGKSRLHLPKKFPSTPQTSQVDPELTAPISKPRSVKRSGKLTAFRSESDSKVVSQIDFFAFLEFFTSVASKSQSCPLDSRTDHKLAFRNGASH